MAAAKCVKQQGLGCKNGDFFWVKLINAEGVFLLPYGKGITRSIFKINSTKKLILTTHPLPLLSILRTFAAHIVCYDTLFPYRICNRPRNAQYIPVMLLTIFKSKIHRAKVTQAELHYVGSITIDANLLDAAGILEGEQVQIVNINNGERFETYTIKGERGSGVVCLNGPAARKVQVGDMIILISYALMTPEEAKNFQPSIVFPDEYNRLPKS